MKVHQIITEHKKGVRAKKYNKKPKAYITPKKPIAGPGPGGSYGADAGYSGVSENIDRAPQLMKAFTKFLPLAMHALDLTHIPKIKLEKIIIDYEQPTFGKYDDQANKIYLAIENRHTLDILRTFAHELVHFKQNTEHRLDDDSGSTGSEIENEANAQAAIIMRHFNKKYPEFFKDEATDLEEDFNENFADGKNPQDKGDSKRHGVPTKASISTLRKVAKQGGRKGQLAHWMANMKSGRQK